MIKTEKLSPKKEEAASILVGQLFLNFGTIEYLSFLVVHTFGDSKDKNKVFLMTLAEKIKEIPRVALKSGLTDEKCKRLIELFHEVDKLAWKRNTVAHGPYIPMKQDGDKLTGGFLDVRKSKGLVPGSLPLLTFNEISAINIRLVEIFEELLSIFNEFVPAPDGNRIS